MSPIYATPFDLDAAALPPLNRPDLEAISRLASQQHGVVARWQAMHLGYSRGWIDSAVTRQLLHPIADGVYALGHTGLSRRGVAIGALLWAGAGSALSHESAARTWRLVAESTDGPIHVSLGRRRGLASTDAIVVHRPRSLAASDLEWHRGLIVTNPERTIRDLLPSASVGEITRMLEQAVTLLGRAPDDLHRWGAGLTQVRGRDKLLRALDNVVGPAVLRSELERRFRTLCQEAGLPLPETNTRFGRWELDALWRDLAIAVELDSWRWHGGRWQFHRDRRKGLALNRAGVELVRLTWAQVKHEPSEVVDTLRVMIHRAEQRRLWLPGSALR